MKTRPVLAACTLFVVAALGHSNSAGARQSALTAINPQPNLVLPWFNGVANFNIASNTNCITGQPETTVSGYTGYTYLPPNRTPAVGEVFYTHLVLSHPGNPCSGSAIGIEMALPAGVQTAVSAANPAFCFARTPNGPTLYNLATDPGYGCPQSYPASANGVRLIPPNGGIGGSGAWGMAQGFWLELLVPLRATAPQSGANQIIWTVNPAIAQFGQVGVGPQVNSDVLMRDWFEDQLVTLDICTLTPLANGC